jgi:hypothetical protein
MVKSEWLVFGRVTLVNFEEFFLLQIIVDIRPPFFRQSRFTNHQSQIFLLTAHRETRRSLFVVGVNMF